MERGRRGEPSTARRQHYRIHQLRIRIGSKWLGLLKEAAPRVGHVSVLINPLVPAWTDVFRRMEPVAPPLGVQMVAAPVKDANEIERAIDAVMREPILD